VKKNYVIKTSYGKRFVKTSIYHSIAHLIALPNRKAMTYTGRKYLFEKYFVD